MSTDKKKVGNCYGPFQKFLVCIGFYPMAESIKKLDDVGSDIDDRKLEADRPPDKPKGGELNFCLILSEYDEV